MPEYWRKIKWKITASSMTLEFWSSSPICLLVFTFCGLQITSLCICTDYSCIQWGQHTGVYPILPQIGTSSGSFIYFAFWGSLPYIRHHWEVLLWPYSSCTAPLLQRHSPTTVRFQYKNLWLSSTESIVNLRNSSAHNAIEDPDPLPYVY